jgi:hypothetical protein
MSVSKFQIIYEIFTNINSNSNPLQNFLHP